ncbi:MAG TPA: IS66 family transposase [Enhygromyxa sp.]|nr:IS66 family transposase [Enhygromyxa sp.]
MVDIERIDDIGVARQVMRLLLAENERLHKRLAELTTQLAGLQNKDGAQQLSLEIARLQEQMADLQRRLFAASTERRAGEDESKPANKPKKRKRGHGPTQQLALAVQEVRHVLDDGSMGCPTCKGQLEPMSGCTEDSELITVVRRQFVLQTHKRQKYRCRCNAAVVTAPGPVKLIPGGRYSLEFAAAIAIDKYVDAMPLTRQARVMTRQGLVVTSQVLWDQLDALAHVLEPCYRALGLWIREVHEVLGADETKWLLMDKRGSQAWWVWSLTSRLAAYYLLDPDRSAAAAKELLADFAGVLVVDGYAAYPAALRHLAHVTLAYCWSHVRRYFVEAEKAAPAQAKEAVDMLRELFMLERQVPWIPTDPWEEYEASLITRARVRAEQSQPLVDEFVAWCRSQTALPRSKLAKAIGYVLDKDRENAKPALRVFLHDPRVPIHNNDTERALRNVVLGRKNHYGSRSVRGTEVAALFYSLCETALIQGVDPAAYLVEAATTELRRPGTALLPHQLK